MNYSIYIPVSCSNPRNPGAKMVLNPEIWLLSTSSHKPLVEFLTNGNVLHDLVDELGRQKIDIPEGLRTSGRRLDHLYRLASD